MKTERRKEVRWSEPRPWNKPLSLWEITAETLNLSSRSSAPPNEIEKIIAPSWAWQMLHRT